MTLRASGRRPDELRAVRLEPGFTKHAEGSCLVRFGDTHVLCTASVDASLPLSTEVAAVSCGLVGGRALLDLDYSEDSGADADANFVLTGAGGIVEIQGTAEQAPFLEAQFLELLALARLGIGQLVTLQRA